MLRFAMVRASHPGYQTVPTCPLAAARLVSAHVVRKGKAECPSFSHDVLPATANAQTERQAGPMSDVAAKSGRPYLVVYAGSAGTLPDRGDPIVACALPIRQ